MNVISSLTMLGHVQIKIEYKQTGKKDIKLHFEKLKKKARMSEDDL